MTVYNVQKIHVFLQLYLSCACSIPQSCLTLCNSIDCVASQVPQSTGFPRQEHWNGLPFPSPGTLPDPGIEPASPAFAGGFFITEPPGKPISIMTNIQNWDRNFPRESNLN